MSWLVSTKKYFCIRLMKITRKKKQQKSNLWTHGECSGRIWLPGWEAKVACLDNRLLMRAQCRMDSHESEIPLYLVYGSVYLAFEMYFMCVLFDMPWTNFALVLSFYFHANIMAFCVTFRIPFPKNNQTSYTNTHSHALKYLFLVRFECLITIDSCAAKKLYAFVSIPTKWWIMARPTLWM